MFSIGDIVLLVSKRTWGGWGGNIRVPYNSKKKLMVVRTVDYRDGSQQLWVKAPNGSIVRGPFCNLRFKHYRIQHMSDYDPTQQGDTDDDI